MIYGYARCSTNEEKQDLQRQTRELKAAGAKEIYCTYEHGDAAVKEQLYTLLDVGAVLYAKLRNKKINYQRENHRLKF